MEYAPFRMERWQSTYEHRVRYNLSESGVHPLTAAELSELSGREADLTGVRLGYGQSNGSDELRARIAALYPGATDASVLVTVGGAEANFAAFWQLVEPGAPVAVMLPNYMQVPGLVENFGARALPFHLREEEGWQPDLGELEAALEAGATFVLVTNPNNPTGAVLTPESMEGIVDAAERHGAWILADEVYQGAEVAGKTTPSFWGRSERVLVTNSLSKAYGLPGLRLGWVVGPDDAVARLWGRTDYTTIAPATLSDALARIALEPGTRARILERTRGIVRRNLGVVAEWASRREGLVSYRPPDAGAICYLRYDAPVESGGFAETLRSEKDVLVVPGDHFGMDRYLRIGFGPPEEELREALSRIAEAFDEVGM
ncbi:MAG TPA: aminotransferase class I/II-fold pyridoxal phosphate-dependent enzyme, partial [Longimicrobiales bacterium]|nr:aminotransferase class I/II-fold pyridoxal phosphate-dependent enzyme [Longimicrobiales bacterium]